MPFIQIKSLPLETPVDISQIIENLAWEFAEQMDIELQHITTTWEYWKPGHYAVAGEASDIQPTHSHPVMIEILAPDFNSPDSIEKMLSTVAASFTRLSGISRNNIFIHYREAHSGRVFDAGEIVRW